MIDNVCSSKVLENGLGLVKNVLVFIEILCPILFIAFISVCFIKGMTNPDDKKLFNRIKNTAFSLIIVFFIPIIANAVMSILGNSTKLSSCWNNATISTERAKYQEISSSYKKKQINENSSDYEKGEKNNNELSNTSTTAAKGNVSKLLSSAKEVTDYVKNNGFSYGDAPINPAMNHDAKLVSCDRCVGWFLYKIGYTDQPKSHGLVVYDSSGERDLSTYLKNHGFTKITNYSDIKAGDIMFVNPSSSGHPGHTFLLGNKVGNGIWERYDCGSNARVHSSQPFKESVSNFMYAYRMPTNS